MIHTPVLTHELIRLFDPSPSSRLLDATLGTGGHTRVFLEAAGKGSSAVGLDADPAALVVARHELASFQGCVTYLNANFANLNDALTGGGIVERGSSSFQEKPSLLSGNLASAGFTHILFDLGIGSHQLASAERGFSFRSAGPLDMRYGQLQSLPESKIQALNGLAKYLEHYPDAEEIIRELTREDLANVLRTYGEERYAGRIARVLHEAPAGMVADQIADLIKRAVPAQYERGRLHPATRTFQALRLAVNRELEALEQALPQAAGLLREKGILAVISFHSLEDRIVKNFLRTVPALTVLTKKPIGPSDAECKQNPRARSAKLRAAQKKSD
jgi:16S rRNA (cytosine1402-N4)-methyltransferase